MLHEFITLNRDEIIRRCRAKVATRSVPPPTVAEIDHGVPLFLDQRIYARNLPDVGCVFTIDLPRISVPALAFD